jgi:hypothetical protein
LVVVFIIPLILALWHHGHSLVWNDILVLVVGIFSLHFHLLHVINNVRLIALLVLILILLLHLLEVHLFLAITLLVFILFSFLFGDVLCHITLPLRLLSFLLASLGIDLFVMVLWDVLRRLATHLLLVHWHVHILLLKHQ